MQLPLPIDRLEDCCWLPRIAAKARAYLAGELSLSYRLAFGSSIGVDGFFLRHFGLSRRRFLAGVAAAADDAALRAWFQAQPTVSPGSVEAWNRLAPKLGTNGHPAYFTRHLVKWVFYLRSVSQPVGSLFEAIEQDERRP